MFHFLKNYIFIFWWKFPFFVIVSILFILLLLCLLLCLYFYFETLSKRKSSSVVLGFSLKGFSTEPGMSSRRVLLLPSGGGMHELQHRDTKTQTRPADAPYWFIEFTDRNEAQRLFRQDYFITFYFTRWISTPQPHHAPPPECHHHAASTGTSWRPSGWCWWTTRVYRACKWPGCSLPAWSADGRL